MQSHRQSILEALDQSKGERKITTYLKRNPYLVLRAFGEFGSHGNYVLAEFGLGKSLRADFVVVQGTSAGWEVDMVELEPVVDDLFNKDRTPTKRLRIAQKQIADWRTCFLTFVRSQTVPEAAPTYWGESESPPGAPLAGHTRCRNDAEPDHVTGCGESVLFAYFASGAGPVLRSFRPSNT